MRPTPSLIFQLPRNGAQLWASGKFQGFDAWVWDHNIALVVNLLGGAGMIGAFTFDMNARSGDEAIEEGCLSNWLSGQNSADTFLNERLESRESRYGRKMVNVRAIH